MTRIVQDREGRNTFIDNRKGGPISTPFLRQPCRFNSGSSAFFIFTSSDTSYEVFKYWNGSSSTSKPFDGVKARWEFTTINNVVYWRFKAVATVDVDLVVDLSSEAWVKPSEDYFIQFVDWTPKRLIAEEQPICNLPSMLQETWGRGLLPSGSDYSDLCYAATENCRVNHANMITLPVELLNTITGKEAIELADHLLQSLDPSSPGCANLISSIYFNGRFGSRLTGIELSQFMENELASNQWRQRLQSKTIGSIQYSGKVFGSFTYQGTAFLSYDYAYRGLNYMIKRWDNASLPTLSDVWDAIPFSFVVDWATGIGDNIARLEHNIYQTAADISNIWLSAKGAFDSQPIVSDSGVMAWSCNYYCRIGRAAVSTASFDLRPTGSVKNLADLTGLLIQGNSSQ
jgi:hypothetical protein